MGRLEEQMVAARESRANSKSETAALHNTLSVVLTCSSSFFSFVFKKGKIQLLHSPRKESITLHCKNAVCKELGLSARLGITCALPMYCSLVGWKREVRS